MLEKAEEFLCSQFLSEVQSIQQEPSHSLLSANLNVYPQVMQVLEKQTFENWKPFLPDLLQWGIQGSSKFSIPHHWSIFNDVVRHFSVMQPSSEYINAWDVAYYKKFLFPQSIIGFWQDYWNYRTIRYIINNFPNMNKSDYHTVAEIYRDIPYPDDIDKQFQYWGNRLKYTLPLNLFHEKSFGFPSRDNADIIRVLGDIKVAMEYCWIHITQTLDFDQKPETNRHKPKALTYRQPTIKRKTHTVFGY